MIDQAERLREIERSVSPQGVDDPNIVSITSGKGGTGKSFIAFYLSQYLSMSGYRTLLVEFDHNLASLAYHLNIEPDYTLLDIFTGRVLFDELYLEVSKNFNIVFGESGKLKYPDNKISYIQNFFQVLRKKASEFDFIIIDNGAGINNEIFETIRLSDFNLIVTLADPVAVMDAYVLIKLMTKNSLRTEKGIVINKCDDFEEGERTFKNLNKASLNFFNEDLKLMGILGNQNPLQNLQIVNATSSIDSSIKQYIERFSHIAERFINFKQLANNHHTASQNNPKNTKKSRKQSR